MNNGFLHPAELEEGSDHRRRSRQEIELLLQIAAHVHMIGGTADALCRRYPQGKPGWEQSACIRREAAALEHVIIQAMRGIISPLPDLGGIRSL